MSEAPEAIHISKKNELVAELEQRILAEEHARDAQGELAIKIVDSHLKGRAAASSDVLDYRIAKNRADNAENLAEQAWQELLAFVQTKKPSAAATAEGNETNTNSAKGIERN